MITDQLRFEVASKSELSPLAFI